MNFELYLESKKIDSTAFRSGDPELWESWKREFEEMHPNSFTVQKLNLINPIRRMYTLPVVEKVVVPAATEAALPKENTTTTSTTPPKPVISKPAVPRPVFKPKPKTE